MGTMPQITLYQGRAAGELLSMSSFHKMYIMYVDSSDLDFIFLSSLMFRK
jgi:hypothetical protein